MKKPDTRKSDIVVQEVNDETLIYDLKTNKAYCLNETSALVYELCDGTRNASEISDEMSVRLKTLVSEEFVWIALDRLYKDELLEGENKSRFAGLSRRDVIKKVGFASVVALPMVSSLIAPTAGMAQSSCSANLIACNAPPDCCSGNCTGSNGRFGSDSCCTSGALGNAPDGHREVCVTSAANCPTFAGICCSNQNFAVPDHPDCFAFTARIACICGTSP